MNNLNLRIKIFETIRDIPYRIGCQENDTSCRAKSKLLGDLLTRTGLECQAVRGISKWSELGLPINLLALIKILCQGDNLCKWEIIVERK